jgi:hypothetical protein
MYQAAIAVGAWGSFGQMNAEEEKADPLALLQQYAPVIQTVTDVTTDPVRQAAVLRAQLQDALARGASARQVSLIQARLAAAERRVALKQEAEGSVRQYRMLGQLGIVTAIGLGAAGIYYVLRRS